MPTVRAAVTADLPAVIALWDRAAGPSRHPGRTVEANRLLARDPEALLVAFEGDTVVGTLIVGWDGWRVHLYRLCVAASARRRGIAAALVDAAGRRAAVLGAARVDAMVREENSGAIGFWSAAGFTVEGDDRRWSLAPGADGPPPVAPTP